MVKFSKQFEAEIVPEWKEAFFDYFQIKKDLKKFHLFNSENNTKQHGNCLPKSLFFSLMKMFNLLQLHATTRHRLIQVHRKLGSEIEGEVYVTELFEQLGESESAIEFFHGLDFQLNKVNQFYQSKEKEFVERGNYLNKQMDILVELKDAIRQQKAKKGSSSQHSNIEDDSISVITISDCDEEEESTTDIREEEQKEHESTTTYESDSSNVWFTDTSKPSETDESENPRRNKKEDEKMLSSRVFKCKGKKKLRIRVPLTSPIRTFSEITYLIWDDLMNKSPKKFGSKGDNMHLKRKNIKHAEKVIRGAFIDLYKGLGYLTTYRNLNILAFMKILEKFDKVTSKQVLPIYLRVVETSYFNSSDKVLKLTDEIEETFINYFGKDDKRKAMKYLKPEQPKESHTVTFFLGLFSGCFLALLVGYVIMAHITQIYPPQHSYFIYMEAAFPVISMFSLLFLHVFLYGCNMYMWRKTRINYSFIFDLCPTKELKYRDVFLICAMSMTVVVGVLFLHLFLFSKGYYTQAQAIPGILLLVFLMVLLCPFNIMYKSSRYRLLSVLRNIILSPLYKVVMLDFFMADQLCSQVPMLRNLEYIACYYITGSYKTQDFGLCMRNKTYMDLAYAVSFLPYYWRAMQCARRWFDEGQKSHLVNLGKYVSAMLAAGAKVAYDKEGNTEWFCIFVIVSSCATVYQLYWDFVKDWGLLQFHSKNPWLRDDLMLSKKYIYYFSMMLNLILRLAWLQTVFHDGIGNHVDNREIGLFLAALEIVRRCHWNFYRLENEHLNNAGNFRAVNSVPLPFHEVDDED